MNINNNMQKQASFKEVAIVSCGTLLPELNHLKKSGFLDAKKILYTTPGRHENPRELKKQLTRISKIIPVIIKDIGSPFLFTLKFLSNVG